MMWDSAKYSCPCGRAPVSPRARVLAHATRSDGGCEWDDDAIICGVSGWAFVCCEFHRACGDLAVALWQRARCFVGLRVAIKFPIP